ncbi:hypothetical protein DTO212C5_7410 [Paecilomyces variotii]|nr:hypothetical protein DTO212C5_7410 [Paecilomyces variotii]
MAEYPDYFMGQRPLYRMRQAGSRLSASAASCSPAPTASRLLAPAASRSSAPAASRSSVPAASPDLDPRASVASPDRSSSPEYEIPWTPTPAPVVESIESTSLPNPESNESSQPEGSSQLWVSRPGKRLTDAQKMEIFNACLLYKQRYLEDAHHNQFWGFVSLRLKQTIGRNYSPQSCKRQVDQITEFRRIELEVKETGREDEPQSAMMVLVDEWIAVQDELRLTKEEAAAAKAAKEAELQKARDHREVLVRTMGLRK